jgi:arylsulfatase A-like enzyme
MNAGRTLISLCCFSLFVIGCGGSAPSPKTIRLTAPQATHMEGRASGIVQVPERSEWRFDHAPAPLPEKFAATYGWEAASGVSDLAIRDGKLSGKSTDDTPLIHFERTPDPQNEDIIYSIELRARVSGGTNLRVGLNGDDTFNIPQATAYFRDFPSLISSTPVIAGDQFQTYTLKPKFNLPANKIRHIVIMPVDRKGGTFDIESLRLIFRKEYLATIQSGVSWQSLGGIYHESIVTRSPERIVMNVQLPERPWLDLTVGTIEDSPVQFQVNVKYGNKEEPLAQRTTTRPYHWDRMPVDLTRFSGQHVSLLLSLKGESKGMLGFWGSPVIRSHGNVVATNAPQGVIVIWSDTTRRDHLDAYGYHRPTAPNLKQMAETGTLFQDCVTQATWTKVASPSLITSMYPATHGVRDFNDRLPSSATTLAEVFENAGYATVNFSSNLFTATFSNFHQGFEELHEDSSLPNPNSSKTSREYMDRLLPWLTAHRDVPFFVFFHAYDAHDPYEPYPPYNTMWADPGKKKKHEHELEEVRKVINDPLMKAFGMPNRAELTKAGFDADAFAAYDRDWYDGSIRGMDAEFGRLFEFLRQERMDRNTLVVFAGDHGEEFLEHNSLFHGQSVYGELTNIPLIFWGPGHIPENAIVKNTVETIDVMPTILEISGLRAPENIQGKSLVPLFSPKKSSSGQVEAAAFRNRPAFSEKAITHDNAAPCPHDTESFAIVRDKWKLIHNKKRHDGVPEYELYDMATDRLNQTNVAGEHPDIVQQLGKELDSWNERASAAKLKADTTTGNGLSQEELERLRSLGYIQ